MRLLEILRRLRGEPETRRVTPSLVKRYARRAEAAVRRATPASQRRPRPGLRRRARTWVAARWKERRSGPLVPARRSSKPRVSVKVAPVGSEPLRVAIKSPAPDHLIGPTWGDYHFAEALGRALRRRGHDVRVDHLDAWYAPDEGPRALDGVIVLRGRSRYRPAPDVPSLLWGISHPDQLEPGELDGYDVVFFASLSFARDLQRTRPDLDVRPLLQAFDRERFRPGPPEPRWASEVLFVGNTRGVLRPIVVDAIAAGLPLTVYGKGWERFLPPRFIGGGPVDNEQLPSLYRSAKVVLNDHWPSMRAEGFLSNRLFDCAACGVVVVTDPVVGLAEVFGSSVPFYFDERDLGDLVRRLLRDDGERRARGEAARGRVEATADFDARAVVIEEALHVAIARRRQRASR